MDLTEAVEIITADLVGIKSKQYYNAFMLVAFADPLELSKITSSFVPDALRNTLAIILAKAIGVDYQVVKVSLHQPLDVKTICAKNSIFPMEFINRKLSRADAPLDNYQLAAAILAYGPESPRFGDAMAYVIEEGEDVPKNVRDDVSNAFKQAAIEDNLAAEQLAAFN